MANFIATDPLAGLGNGTDGRALAAGQNGAQRDPRLALVKADVTGNPPDGRLVVMRRHVDWLEHQVRWRWLLDSLEGGDRYRNAVYGPDRKGLPARNLFRHRREYPDAQQFPQIYEGYAGGFIGAINTQTQDVGYGPYPGMIGADPAANAQDDDYELRRSRTPVPEFVAEAVEMHLGKIYDQEVHREGPDDLTAWWNDVDGAGTPVDDWMRDKVAPLLLVLGSLDVVLDHPRAPSGAKSTRKRTRPRSGSIRASPPTYSHKTWSGGVPMRPAAISSAWCESIRTPPTGSIMTRMATRLTPRTRGTSARPGGSTTSAGGSGTTPSRSSTRTTAAKSSSASRTTSGASRSFD